MRPFSALALCLGLMPLAMAQTPDAEPGPAVNFEQDRADTSADEIGTTIIGERESPVGLYITPWRNAYAEQELDRPARLLQVDMSPIDRDVFQRRLEYYSALEDAREGLIKPQPAGA
ncbi:MAG: hypothetical protein ACPGZP_06420, partial [Panacagrimonas sp.]